MGFGPYERIFRQKRWSKVMASSDIHANIYVFGFGVKKPTDNWLHCEELTCGRQEYVV